MTSFAIAPDKKTFTTGHIGGLRLWDSGSGDQIRNFNLTQPVATTPWYSADGSRLLFAYHSKLYRAVIAPPQGGVVNNHEGGLGAFEAVAEVKPDRAATGTISPDQRYWAITESGFSATLSLGLHLDDRPRILATRTSHEQPTALIWGEESRTLYVGNRTGTIDVFRIQPR